MGSTVAERRANATVEFIVCSVWFSVVARCLALSPKHEAFAGTCIAQRR